MERLITGHQTPLSMPSVPGSASPTEYISLYWKPASRLKISCAKWRRAMGGGAQGAIQILQRWDGKGWAPLRFSSSHEPTLAPMSE